MYYCKEPPLYIIMTKTFCPYSAIYGKQFCAYRYVHVNAYIPKHSRTGYNEDPLVSFSYLLYLENCLAILLKIFQFYKFKFKQQFLPKARKLISWL